MELADHGVDWIGALAKNGDAEALMIGGESISYARLGEMSRNLVNDLNALDLEAGDLVAVLATPSVPGVALIHALLDRRIVLLPLNARLAEIEQLDLLMRARPRFLIVSESIDDGLAHRLVERGECGLVLLSPGEGRSGSLIEKRSGVRGVDGPDIDPHCDREIRRGLDLALVLSTSGTSGPPKLAMLSRENLVSSARASTEMLGHQRDDRWLLCMPLFHIGGLSVLVRSALVGTSVVVHEDFDPQRVADSLEADRITRVSFVATMLERVIDVRGEKRSPASLVLVVLGGGPATTELLHRAESLGYPVAPTYGLTEAASQVATRPPLHEAERPIAPDRDLAAGLQALADVELRIVDADGGRVADGVEGEICVRGPIVMQGYFEDPVATSEAIAIGWLMTGDIGRLDAAGHLRVLDRRSDLILSGGENVYPAEIESVIASHPDVEQVGVTGRPDAKFGSRPIAFVVWRGSEPMDAETLEALCRERLAGYKVPVAFFEAPHLPRTTSGKLIRRLLRRDA